MAGVSLTKKKKTKLKQKKPTQMIYAPKLKL